MKIGSKSSAMVASTRTDRNSSKKNLLLGVVLVITVVLIIWVYAMGRKAEETISVVMLADNIYKNEVITESSLKEYQMLKGEYEKYAVVDENGVQKRRILKWEERSMIINSFAAYPLQADTVAMYDNFIVSRTDNSDTVLYSYPGKNIVKLDVGDDDLDAFKTFLQPGDRINVIAIFKSSEKVYVDDGYGNTTTETVDTYREEEVFTDIMLADLLNDDGESVLDLYAEYNEKTTYQQAALDSSESWLESVQPSVMLVALTPEEETQYYKYLSKSDVEFRISLPQRTN
jgi:hypothetical protein